MTCVDASPVFVCRGIVCMHQTDVERQTPLDLSAETRLDEDEQARFPGAYKKSGEVVTPEVRTVRPHSHCVWALGIDHIRVLG